MKKTKYLILILAPIVAVLFVMCNQNKSNTATEKVISKSTKVNGNNTLNATILQVVKAYNAKDAQKLNELINTETGITFFYRQGAFNGYEKEPAIDFEKPVPEYFPYTELVTDYKIRFESLPVYDCDTEMWSKTGLFCDTTQSDHLFSQILKDLVEYRGDRIPKTEIEKYVTLENNSHRIVLTDKNNDQLIFYLTRINNKWQLTIIDRASGDCSA